MPDTADNSDLKPQSVGAECDLWFAHPVDGHMISMAEYNEVMSRLSGVPPLGLLSERKPR
jgi:hypothetical protein